MCYLLYSKTRLIQHYRKTPSRVLAHPSPPPAHPCTRLLLAAKVTRDFQYENNIFLPYLDHRSVLTSRSRYWKDRLSNAKVKQLKLQYLYSLDARRTYLDISTELVVNVIISWLLRK